MKIVTQSCGGEKSIFNIPYIDMVGEMLDESIEIIDTKYYNYIKNLWLNKNRLLWGDIRTEEDLINRGLTFRSLAINIKNNGFNPEIGKIYKYNNLPYGKMTVIQKGSKWFLIDGHHRVSVLILLGIKEFEIVDNLYLIPKL